MRYLTIFIVMASGFITACTGLEDEPQGDAGVRIYLADAPGDYQEVNIDVVAVRMIINDSIVDLHTNTGIYNILDFTNGSDTLLVEDDIPEGHLSQIRLVLGENNTVMKDSSIHDLKTPSAQQSGLKLNVHEDIKPGILYAYVLDFEAERSIVQTGNGRHQLKPVIRVFANAISGTLEGVSWPPDAMTLIRVIHDVDTFETAADTNTGKFMVRGLSEGNYNVHFEPSEAYRDTILSDIFIMAGQVTRLDTMKLRTAE